MKNSKPAPHASRQEDCGVWLDPAGLKEKAKQVWFSNSLEMSCHSGSGPIVVDTVVSDTALTVLGQFLIKIRKYTSLFIPETTVPAHIQTTESFGTIWRLQSCSGTELHTDQKTDACHQTELHILILCSTVQR